MQCRELVITLVSATNLPDVRSFGDMKVYGNLWIQGDETQTSIKSTPTDMRGQTNPRWYCPIRFTVGESAIRQSDVYLVIELVCERTFLEDKFVGQVCIPIKSLFDMGLKANRVLSYPVDGTRNGRLDILYGFGDKKLFVHEKLSSSSSGRSSWKGAVGIGFLVLGGVLLLFGGRKRVDDHEISYDDDDDDDEYEYEYDVRSALSPKRDIRRAVDESDFEVDHKGRVFYDAR
ncbi:hypothetical protein PHJA_000578400 [Phtheirospermum japonicum]|uniref:C2 domain-containing protein n=1 Tax=Phtheirospermum japonicum TaxID=374723 RepID=A0A830BBC8_9LAMI|nr:hypothetical protein PHJA_000578400 [Phtheirospermum japonicum]